MLFNFLKDSGSFYKANFWSFLAIMAPILIPFEIISALYQSFFIVEESTGLEQGVMVFLGILIEPLIMIPVVFYIQSVVSGKVVDKNSYWDLRIRYWAPYLIASFLVLGVVLSGLFLLIVPGIIFAVRYAFVDFELLLNNEPPIEAMKKSWDTTKDYFWDVLFGTILIGVVFYIPYYFVSSMVTADSLLYWPFTIVMNVLFSMLGVFYIVFYFRVFDFHRSQTVESKGVENKGVEE